MTHTRACTFGVRGDIARLLGVLLLVSLMATSQAATPPQAAVASAHPQATAAGHEILAAGGNAFDAAVAVTAALGVVEPMSSGLGGGGFWLLHQAAEERQVMVDGREQAPQKAHRDMYLDDEGEKIPGASIDGPLAAGIPGTPAALAHIAKRYGKLPLSQSLAPAIRLAREGFEVTEDYRRMAEFRRQTLQDSPAAAAVFLDEGEVPALGTTIKQPHLAQTLESLAEEGASGFYQGPVAEQLVKGVQAAGGIWTHADLRNYQVKEREPIRGDYQGIQLVGAAPPSSGGIALVTMLNILSGYDLAALSPIKRTHVIVEAMRRAYRDRAVHLGDTDYTDVPVERLTHPHYAAGLRASIRLDRPTASQALPAAPLSSQPRGQDTSHFSILDRQGNRVAATLSINFPFGAGFMPAGTGVLLNDEMDDFSAKPGAPNVYGLIGGEANAIEPGKRPLSSMSPTFLETEERVAILGTPGGSRIITMVLLATLDFAQDHGPSAWVGLKRFHHQFLPNAIQYEPGTFSTEEQTALRELGHELKDVGRRYGDMQAVLWDRQQGHVQAASDPRGRGRAEVR